LPILSRDTSRRVPVLGQRHNHRTTLTAHRPPPGRRTPARCEGCAVGVRLGDRGGRLSTTIRDPALPPVAWLTEMSGEYTDRATASRLSRLVLKSGVRDIGGPGQGQHADRLPAPSPRRPHRGRAPSRDPGEIAELVGLRRGTVLPAIGRSEWHRVPPPATSASIATGGGATSPKGVPPRAKTPAPRSATTSRTTTPRSWPRSKRGWRPLAAVRR